jgi:hypothetical protein
MRSVGDTLAAGSEMGLIRGNITADRRNVLHSAYRWVQDDISWQSCVHKLAQCFAAGSSFASVLDFGHAGERISVRHTGPPI